MLQMVRNIILSCAAMLAVSSCNKMDFKGFFVPTGDVVQERFEQSMEMTEGKAVQGVETKDRYTLYVCTDPHVDTSADNLQKFNNALRTDSDAGLGIILGDCVNEKDKYQEYLTATRYDAEKHAYNHNIYHVLGNHDTHFVGWGKFKSLLGPSVYWFEVGFPTGKDLYIALDTASGTLGRKQTEWLKSFLESNRSKYRYCIIVTHTYFFYNGNTEFTSATMPLEESFALMELFARHEVNLVLQGHNHYRKDMTYDNVKYTVLGTISDDSDSPEYLKIAVKEDCISYTWAKP
jgi:UDP-2,3-diacylglucosamine pyrophosphatase LpxH